MSFPSGQGSAANTTLLWDGTKWVSTPLVTSIASADTNVITVSVVAGAATLDAPFIMIQPTSIAMGEGIPFGTIAAAIGNVYLGASAGNGTGASNVAIGRQAGTAFTTAHDNVYIGVGAGQAETTGNHNVVIGDGALKASVGSSGCVVIGDAAASAMTSLGVAIIIGANAALSATDLSTGIIIGEHAASNATGATGCVFIGNQAGNGNGGTQNVAIGSQAMSFPAVVGSGNIAIGNQTLSTFNTGDGNIAIGNQVAATFNNGGGNVFLNANADSGDTNVYINGAAGATTGSNNVVLGLPNAGIGTTIDAGSGNIIIKGNPAANGISNSVNLNDQILSTPTAVALLPNAVSDVLSQTSNTTAYSPTDTTSPLGMKTIGANGAVTRFFSGNRSPVGAVTANPGDYYYESNGPSSSLFLHTGAGADNTNWVPFTHTAVAGATFVDQEVALFSGTTGSQITSTGGAVRYTTSPTDRTMTIQAANVGINARWALKNPGGGFVGFFQYNVANVATELVVPIGTTFNINGGNGVHVGGYVFPATPNIAPNWQLPISGIDGTPLRIDLAGGQFILDGVLTNMVSVSYGISVQNGGATPTFVWSATGSKVIFNLDQNATVSFGDPFPGTDLTLIVNNAPGAFTVTWPANVLWPGGVAPALNVANSKTKIEFFFDGTDYWGTFELNFAP